MCYVRIKILHSLKIKTRLYVEFDIYNRCWVERCYQVKMHYTKINLPIPMLIGSYFIDGHLLHLLHHMILHYNVLLKF